MKSFGFLCLLVLIGTTAFMCLSITPPNSGVNAIGSNVMAFIMKSRKLKENTDPPAVVDQGDVGHVNLEDYRPIDPVPSSKASIRPGPVQHGTPLMPYIPKPSPPPGKPKRGG